MSKLRLLCLSLGLLLASLILGGCSAAGYYNSGYYPEPDVIIIEVPDCGGSSDHGPIVVDRHEPERKTPLSRDLVNVSPPSRTKTRENVSSSKQPVAGRGKTNLRR